MNVSDTNEPYVQGFTLYEVLMVLVITAVLGAIAVPQLAELNRPMYRMNARSGVIQDMKRAQAESITKGCRGILKFFNDGRNYSFGCDFLPYDVAIPPSADNITFSREFPGLIKATAENTMIFNSHGQSVDADGIISNAQVVLSDQGYAFSNGILYGTGLFEFEAVE